MIKVILYYNFSPIKNPEHFRDEHHQFCLDHNLLGRVLISREGINGTLSGGTEEIDLYKQYLCGIKGFDDTQFKEDVCQENLFYRLRVKTRPEMVTLKPDVPIELKKDEKGYLSPEEWKKQLDAHENFILLDVRNDYETKIGHFKGAVTPNVKNFYDFPKWLAEAGLDKNKKVLMYCTGGIRCEKFSVFMKAKGFREIYQLHGGIINYAQKAGGKYFKGKCFVFDDRMAVPVNKEEPQPITACDICGTPADTYLNCANMDCNKLFLCCEESARKMQGCCSSECMSALRRREFDAEHIYRPFRRWYAYFNDKNGNRHSERSEESQ